MLQAILQRRARVRLDMLVKQGLQVEMRKRQGFESLGLSLGFLLRVDEAQPERFEALSFSHFYLQPLFDEHIEANTRAALKYCLQHPRWKLSVQMHKVIGIE